MSLRAKLLLVGLVILVLPWSAMRFIGTTERLLRQGESEAQLAATETLARALAESIRSPPQGPTLYAPAIGDNLWIDGYGEDWPDAPEHGRALTTDTAAADSATARLRLAAGDRHYYLLIEVTDSDIIYRPGPGSEETAYDRVRLDLQGDGRAGPLFITTAAPGNVSARTADGTPLPRINGAWRETGDGYSVELQLPRSMVGDSLGIAVSDATSRDGPMRWATAGTAEQRLAILERRRRLDDRLGELAALGGQAWIVAPGGWVLAAHQRPSPRDDDASGGLLRNLVYRHILASPLEPAVDRSTASMHLEGPEVAAALQGRAGSTWRAAGGSGVRVSTGQPIRGPDGSVRAAVVTERTGEGVLLLTDSAMGPVLGTVLGAMSVALGALVLYAAHLSNRIRRLRDAAAAAVDDAGTVTTALPQRDQRDELGDLARGFQTTLTRVDDYTRYLRSLTSKLSHELRTPLTMVTSSLENLAARPLDEQGQRYAGRAQDGAKRLDRILRAMSEATRVEQSLQGEAFESFELTEVLTPLMEAYREMHTDHRIAWTPDGQTHPVRGSPELIGQLVDKLLDNAVGFTPSGGWIEVRLKREDGMSALRIANEGPGLPEHMQGNLFDSLVSVRQDGSDDERPHLGLGLYIVRIIADVHGGRVAAANRAEGDGAVFTLYLPLAREGAS